MGLKKKRLRKLAKNTAETKTSNEFEDTIGNEEPEVGQNFAENMSENVLSKGTPKSL